MPREGIRPGSVNAAYISAHVPHVHLSPVEVEFISEFGECSRVTKYERVSLHGQTVAAFRHEVKYSLYVSIHVL